MVRLKAILRFIINENIVSYAIPYQSVPSTTFRWKFRYTKTSAVKTFKQNKVDITQGPWDHKNMWVFRLKAIPRFSTNDNITLFLCLREHFAEGLVTPKPS